MKRIRMLVVLPTEEQLREVTANLNESDVEVVKQRLVISYKQLITSALRTPLDSRGGVGIEEMEKSLNILKLVDESNGVLELDDADHEYLLLKLSVVRWAGFDHRIVDFVHSVRNATKDLLDDVHTSST